MSVQPGRSDRRPAAKLTLLVLGMLLIGGLVVFALGRADTGQTGGGGAGQPEQGQAPDNNTPDNALEDLDPPGTAGAGGQTTATGARGEPVDREATRADAPSTPPRTSPRTSPPAPPPGYEGAPNPLGRDEQRLDEAQLEETGIKLLVSEFVSAAYGYTGSDAAEYYSALDYSVLKSSFEQSPGEERLLSTRRGLRAGSVESFENAARLESVRYVREVPWEELEDTVPAEGRAPAYEVVIRYTVGQGWNFEGGVSRLGGRTTTYEQRVTVLEWTVAGTGERAEGGWKVARGSAPEEVAAS